MKLKDYDSFNNTRIVNENVDEQNPRNFYADLNSIITDLERFCGKLHDTQKNNGDLVGFEINAVKVAITDLQNFVKDIESSGLLDEPVSDMVLNIKPYFILNVRKTVAKYKSLKTKNEILYSSCVDCKGEFSKMGKFKTGKFKNINNMTILNRKIDNLFLDESNLNDDSLWEDIVDFCKPIKLK